MSKRQYFKRFAIAACGLAIVAQTFLMPAKSVYADISGDYTATISNVMRMMNDAAKMQLLTHKMKMCLTAGRINDDSNYSEVWNQGKLWKNHWLGNDTTVATGYYLEAIAGSNKSQDGKMFCGEGAGDDQNDGNELFKTFLNTLEKEGVVEGKEPWQQVICSKDDSSLSGIFARVGSSDSKETPNSTNKVPCDTGVNLYGNVASWTVSTGGEAYLGRLYTEWVKAYDGGRGNDYAVSYANIGNYGGTGEPESKQVGATAYFLWTKEISVFCSAYTPSASTQFKTSQIEPRGGENAFDTKLIWVGTEAEDGAATREISVKKGGGAPGALGATQSNTFGANKRTCEELIAAANEAVANVQAEYREILTNLCQEEVKRQIAEARATLATRYPDGAEFSEEDQAAYEELLAFENKTGLDKYIVNQKTSTAPAPNNEGGWQCVDKDEMPFLTIIVQGEYGNDEENNSTGGNNTGEADPCFSHAGALGWIVCPVITMANQALEAVYGWIEQNYLAVNSNIFTNADTGVQSTWGTIRDIANILFVILILVVIFSQLTGFGIDNYGVKKILPKLIIAAVLINLSFVVCQLAVDVSNIVGFGLKAFLGNAVSLTTQAEAAGVSPTGLQITANVFIGVGAVAAAILINPAVIITLLVFVVTALISVLFMWIILLVRQVGVVLAVIVSPLAFACYLLPNTQGLFKKWVNIFKGLLLVFPLCSLLIGGGTMGAKILANVGAGMPPGEGSAFLLAAMVLQVVPFFFVPMLLKGSLAGLGNIGAKLSGLGSGLRKRANQGINNMESVKQKKARLNAGVNKKGEVTGLGKVRAGFANSKVGRKVGAQGTMARNRAAYLKGQREEAAAASLTGAGFSAALAKQESDVNKEQLENEMALMKEETNNYDVDNMNGQLKDLMAKDQLTAQDEVRAKALMKKLATSGGYGQKVMANTISGNGVKASGRQLASKFMSADSDVGSAVAKKNGMAAQYMRDLNSGVTSAATMDAWKKENRQVGTDAAGAPIMKSNEKFVAEDVLTDDNDFAGQSAGAVQSMLGRQSDGSYDATKSTISSDRLQRMLDNERLMQTADGDVAEALKAAATARGMTSTAQAQQAAKQAEQDKVFDVQQRSLRAANEQNARARGLEAVRIGSTLQNSGREVDGYAPPSGEGFDLSDASSVTSGVQVAGSSTPPDVIIKSTDGKTKWNITRGRYED